MLSLSVSHNSNDYNDVLQLLESDAEHEKGVTIKVEAEVNVESIQTVQGINCSLK